MGKQSEINRRAWNYRAYEWWNKYNGTPKEAAQKMVADPRQWVRRHIEYLGDVKEKKIANLLGSNGRKAVPLALLGADVTIVDISDENEKYAMELAKEAGVGLKYIVSDLITINEDSLHNYFDIVYLEGGILHYFSDLSALASKICSILRPGGKLVLNDAHPVRKILRYYQDNVEVEGDYFSSELKYDNVAYKDRFPEDEQKDFPDCLLRHWTMGEIITSFASAGFMIKQLVEEPKIKNSNIPGLFTLIAYK